MAPTIDILQSNIEQLLGNKVFNFQTPYQMLTFHTAAADLVEVVGKLKGMEGTPFHFLTDVTAVHFPDRVGAEFESVAHLHCLTSNVRIRIKVAVPTEAPNVPTLSGLFESANWMERETYDFFGINYTGHPRLERILNLDDMDYFPLRKEYPLEDPARRDKVDSMFGR